MLRVSLPDFEENAFPAYYRIEDGAVFTDLGAALHVASKGFSCGIKYENEPAPAIFFTWEDGAGSMGESMLNMEDTPDGKRWLVRLPPVEWNVQGLTAGKDGPAGKRSTITTFSPVPMQGIVLGFGSMMPESEERLVAGVMVAFDPDFEIEFGQFLMDLGNSLKNGMFHK